MVVHPVHASIADSAVVRAGRFGLATLETVFDEHFGEFVAQGGLHELIRGEARVGPHAAQPGNDGVLLAEQHDQIHETHRVVETQARNQLLRGFRFLTKHLSHLKEVRRAKHLTQSDY